MITITFPLLMVWLIGIAIFLHSCASIIQVIEWLFQRKIRKLRIEMEDLHSHREGLKKGRDYHDVEDLYE